MPDLQPPRPPSTLPYTWEARSALIALGSKIDLPEGVTFGAPSRRGGDRDDDNQATELPIYWDVEFHEQGGPGRYSQRGLSLKIKSSPLGGSFEQL